MKWIIILTTCVEHMNENSINKPRLDLYLKQLKLWLQNTTFTIYLVESSNNGRCFLPLKEKYPNRLNIVTFNQKKLYPNWSGSSLLEAASIKHVMDKLIKNEKDCTHVLKVTGRYFLSDIESKLSNVTQDDCILKQKHCDHPKAPW